MLITRVVEPYEHYPVIRHVNDKNIATFGPWACVLHDMIKSARRNRRRWEQAAFDAAHAEGKTNMYDAEFPRARLAVARYRKDVKRLVMMLALEIAERDMANLDEEIIACFAKGKQHMQETIVRRLFAVPRGMRVDYDWEVHVHRLMADMQRANRLGIEHGFGNHRRTKWYVMTPEIIEQRQMAAQRRKRAEAARQVEIAARDALLARLREAGIAARERNCNHTEVIVNAKDLELLLEKALEKAS